MREVYLRSTTHACGITVSKLELSTRFGDCCIRLNLAVHFLSAVGGLDLGEKRACPKIQTPVACLNEYIIRALQ